MKTTRICSTEPDHIATTGIYPVVRVGCRLGAMDSGITNGVSKWAIDFQAYSCIFPSIADRLYCFNPDLFLISKKIWSNQSCWSNPDSSWWKLWKTCRPCILCKLDGAILALTNFCRRICLVHYVIRASVLPDSSCRYCVLLESQCCWTPAVVTCPFSLTSMCYCIG